MMMMMISGYRTTSLTAADFVELGSTVDDAVAAVVRRNTVIFAGTAILVVGAVATTLATRAH